MLFFQSALLAGGWSEFNKTIKKEFPISANGTINLTNKYGKVDIKTWDKNRVKLDISITVRAKSEKNAQNVFDRISINFSNTSDLVKAITEIQPKKSGSIFPNWNGNNKSDFYIDYEVYLPANCKLEVANKYGDLYIDEMNAPLSINVRHGNFKVDGSTDNVRVEMAHSNGTLVSGKDVSFSMKHSNLTLLKASDVELSSKHSNITIEEARSVRCSSKYDNYKIGKVVEIKNNGKYDNFELGSVKDITVSAKYTHVKAKEVLNLIDFNMEYGGCSIQELNRDFSEVQLDGRHTDFKIMIQKGSNFKLSALGTYAGIKYPSGLVPTYEVEKGSKHEVKGYMGSESTSKTITAGLSYGGLKIVQK